MTNAPPNNNNGTTTTELNRRSLLSLFFHKNNYETTKQTRLYNNFDTKLSSQKGQGGDYTRTIGTATTLTTTTTTTTTMNNNNNNDDYYYTEELSVSCHDNCDDDAPASPSALTTVTKTNKRRRIFWKKWLFPYCN
jgi:hypothetical protein